jgi:hypothetical protein
VVRAHDITTGNLQWEDQYPGLGGLCLCHATDIAVDKGRVFAVGHATNGQTWFVRAYEAKRGALLWHDEILFPAGDGAQAVATDKGKVFVAGSGSNTIGAADFIIRAYDAE